MPRKPPCTPDEIVNPASGFCVKRTGVIGKRILKSIQPQDTINTTTKILIPRKSFFTIVLPYKFHGHQLELEFTWDPDSLSIQGHVPLPKLPPGQSILVDYLRTKLPSLYFSSLAYIYIHYQQDKHHLHMSSFYVKTQLHADLSTYSEIKSLRGLGRTMLCNALQALDRHAPFQKNNLKIWIEAGGGKFTGSLPKDHAKILDDAHDMIDILDIDVEKLKKEKNVITMAKKLLASMPDSYNNYEVATIRDTKECLKILYDIMENFKLMRYYERVYSFKVAGEITDGQGIVMEADYKKVLNICKKSS